MKGTFRANLDLLKYVKKYYEDQIGNKTKINSSNNTRSLIEKEIEIYKNTLIKIQMVLKGDNGPFAQKIRQVLNPNPNPQLIHPINQNPLQLQKSQQPQQQPTPKPLQSQQLLKQTKPLPKRGLKYQKRNSDLIDLISPIKMQTLKNIYEELSFPIFND